MKKNTSTSTHMHRRRLLMTLTASTLASFGVRAQQRSASLIKIIIGVAPGNGADLLARALGEKLSVQLNVPVIVENKPGANNRIAISAAKNAPADGKTILITTSSAMLLNPLIFRNVPYDPDRDFAPIAQIGNNQIAMTVAGTSALKNLGDLVAWLKENPQRAQFGNEGVGSPGHLLGLYLGIKAGVPMTFVPYNATGQMLTDHLAGQIPIATWGLPSVYEHHKAGTLRIVGVAGPQRSPVAPDLPTFNEQGLDIEMISSYGAYFPAGTPKAIIQHMSQALVNVVKEPSIQTRLKQIGVDPTGVEVTAYQQLIAADKLRWQKMVRETGFKID